jgi:hypothetical protein
MENIRKLGLRLEVTVNARRQSPVSEPLLVRTTLTAKEMERLGRLRRRGDWLKRRIANHRGDPGFDKAELGDRGSNASGDCLFTDLFELPTDAPAFLSCLRSTIS